MKGDSPGKNRYNEDRRKEAVITWQCRFIYETKKQRSSEEVNPPCLIMSLWMKKQHFHWQTELKSWQAAPGQHPAALPEKLSVWLLSGNNPPVSGNMGSQTSVQNPPWHFELQGFFVFSSLAITNKICFPTCPFDIFIAKTHIPRPWG